MKNKALLTPIILILLGLILLFIPGTILTTVVKVVGIICISCSIIYIIDNIKNNNSSLELLYSLTIGIIGILILIFPKFTVSIFPLMIGLWMIIKSLVKFQAILILKDLGNKNWIKLILINILTLLIGMLLAFNPFEGAEAIIRILAVFILIYAVFDVINYVLSKPKKVKVIK